MTLTVLLNLILATWALGGIWQVKDRGSVCECTAGICMATMPLLWLLPAVPTLPYLLISTHLYLLFTPSPPPTPPPLSRSLSSGPWHYPSNITLPTGEPYWLPASAGTPLPFLLNVSDKWRNDKNKMCGIYLYKARKYERGERCHGWLSWSSTSRSQLITNEQWSLQNSQICRQRLASSPRSFTACWQRRRRERRWLQIEATVNWHLARGPS